MRPLDRHNKRLELGMSTYSEILLDIISTKEKMMVMEVIHEAVDKKVGSLATLHKALKWLTDEKFINFKVNDGDTRMRACSIAHRGTLYLKGF
jgi:Fe2+ or Zn2+ uptake regulation protein